MLYSSSIMNLLCDVSMFQVNHIFFLDTKKNMVIDGKFTKIVYSDAVVSLNGLYMYFPIESDSKMLTKNTSRFITSNDAILREHRSLADNHGKGQTERVASSLLTQKGALHLEPAKRVPSCYADPEKFGSAIVTKKIPFVFSLLNSANIYLIKELNRIEHEIIEHYKEFFQIHKTNVYSLRNQLKSGNIKVVHKIPQLSSDYEHILTEVGIDTDDCIRPNFSGDLPIVVKISGIWETDTNIGITFKFQI